MANQKVMQQMLKRGAIPTKEEMQPKNLNAYKLEKGATFILTELQLC